MKCDMRGRCMVSYGSRQTLIQQAPFAVRRLQQFEQLGKVRTSTCCQAASPRPTYLLPSRLALTPRASHTAQRRLAPRTCHGILTPQPHHLLAIAVGELRYKTLEVGVFEVKSNTRLLFLVQHAWLHVTCAMWSNSVLRTRNTRGMIQLHSRLSLTTTLNSCD